MRFLPAGNTPGEALRAGGRRPSDPENLSISGQAFLLSTAKRLFLVFALWLAGLGAAAQYGKISVLFQPLAEGYGRSEPVTGLLVSSVGLVGILFGAIAGGLVAAIGAKPSLILGLALGAAVSFVQALGLPFVLLIGTRIIEGISHLMLVVAAPTLIAALSPPAFRGALLTLWGTFFGDALALLVWLGLPLSDSFGIWLVFWAHGLYMSFFGAVLAFSIPSSASATDVDLRHAWQQQFLVYRSPALAAPAVGWLFYTFTFVSLFTLLPPFVPEENRAFVIGMMPLISIVSSLTIGTALLRRITAIQVVMLGFATAGSAGVFLMFFPGNMVIIFALTAALGLIQGASFAAVPELVSDDEGRARANGGMAQMGNLGNTLGTPVLALVISISGHLGMMVLACLVLGAGFGAHALMANARA